MQRALIHYNKPENRKTVLKALKAAGRENIAEVLLGKGNDKSSLGGKNEPDRKNGRGNGRKQKPVSKRRR